MGNPQLIRRLFFFASFGEGLYRMPRTKTLTEKWVYFLKYAENLEVIPDNINDEGLKSAYEEANIQTWTQEELDAYEYAFMREEDEKARLDIAEMKGKIDGIHGLFSNGVSVEIIAKSFNLTELEVREVVENQKNK
jgi:hypothetical protein